MIRIKALLLITFSVFFIQACNDSDDEAPLATIVDVAEANGNFTTFVAALRATGLDNTLSDTSSTYTVFAPTDAAFALLGDDAISALLDDTDTLSNILTYHVINGQVSSVAAEAAIGITVEMVNGDSIGISSDGDNLLINTATVTTTDIETDNGIIHVIDAVLMPPTEKGTPTENIVEAAISAGNFTTLVSLLEATGLDEALANEDNTFTVFAPTDAAFAMIDEETLGLLLDNPNVLASILLQHVLAGVEVDSVNAYALNGTSILTASQALIDVSINASTDVLMFGGSNLVLKDIYTSNGVIHVIDAVVIGEVALPEPPISLVDVARENGNFTTLIAALEATGLDIVLSDTDSAYTVFAPSDAAFDKLPEGTVANLLADTEALSDILLYHVLAGNITSDTAITVAQSSGNLITMENNDNTALSFVDSTLFVNNGSVVTTDIMADNGTIHVLDTVLMPPLEKGEPTQNIVDVVAADDRFTKLVDALTAANLVDALANEESTFTVFAPTNDAFDKIDSAALDVLLADTETLREVLLQHVITAEVNSVSTYSLNGKSIGTASGNDVGISIDGATGSLHFGGAKVIITDIYTSNGIIHVIDAVVLEP